jgi:hypothetical protein
MARRSLDLIEAMYAEAEAAQPPVMMKSPDA